MVDVLHVSILSHFQCVNKQDTFDWSVIISISYDDDWNPPK